jgi:pseudouridine-5'-phosphate glycosidase
MLSVWYLLAFAKISKKYEAFVPLIFSNFSYVFDKENLRSALLIKHSLKKKIDSGLPVVSIETAILTHGMPLESGKIFIHSAFRACRDSGVSPAFLSMKDGGICIGSSEKELITLMNRDNLKKISYRNIGIAMSQKWSGGTTVSAGVHIANQAGLSVFCTGGIGGVHRDFSQQFDMSQDLLALSRTPIIVITSGAKAILDMQKTFEALEFFGVPIVGYQTSRFPSFWSRDSDLPVDVTAKTPQEIADIWKHHLLSGVRSGLIVANPVPKNYQIPFSKLTNVIDRAAKKAKSTGISGPELTPFLLQDLNDKTDGKCLETNVALAVNNVRLGTEISKLI